jgi:hypothetical protein
MFYDLTVVQFSKMLNNLSSILAKGEDFAEAKKCDTAKLSVARLTGQQDSAPKHEDNETTVAELQTRITSVIGYLATFKAEDFVGAQTRKITHHRWNDKYLTGHDFLLEHAIPNVHFHITTAYSILRHNGVEVGKKDYLGAMSFKS